MFSSIFKGLNVNENIFALLRIKPLIAQGYKITDSQQIYKYWFKYKDGLFKDWLYENFHIIDQLHFTKQKINNLHLVLSIFSGHYYYWYLNTSRVKVRTCNVCGCKLDLNVFKSETPCCGLKIIGKVPVEYVKNKENRDFLKWVDNLKYRQYFYNEFTNSFWKFEENNRYEINEKLSIKPALKSNDEDNLYDRAHKKDYVICYTDGSADLYKYAGAGIHFANGDVFGLEDKALIVPLSKTNQRAELYAIAVAIMLTSHITYKLIIKTDSQYSIDTVTKFYLRWRAKGEEFLNKVKNYDLIEFIHQQWTYRDIEFKKVKGHAHIVGNILSDALSRYGSLLDKSLSDPSIVIQDYYNKNLKQYNLIMSTNNVVVNRDLLNLAENDERLVKEIDPRTRKAYVKVPIFKWCPSLTLTLEGMHEFLMNVWNSFRLSYRLQNLPAWDTTKLHHIMDIIHGYEFIKSAERRTQNRIVGFNIKTLGKFDCTIVGIWIHMLQNMQYFDYAGNPIEGVAIGRKFNLDFSSIMMNNSNDTTRAHFQVRASQGSFKDWVESRIGRFTPREYWDIYRIDTEAAKDKVQEKIDEGDKAYELILKNLKLD